MIINATIPIIRLPKPYLGVPNNLEFDLGVLGNPKAGLGLVGAYISLSFESARVMRDIP